jgi:hypothetical protein
VTQNLTKTSYTIPCSSEFRDAVTGLADRRRVNVADLARSIVLTLPTDVISQFPDPGEPPSGDRETVILKSGRSKGRPWQRKPRLQVRMAPGYEVKLLRQALNMVLAMDKGTVEIHVDAPEFGLHPEAIRNGKKADRALLEVDKLKSIISVLAFEPLKTEVETRADALYVMGYHAMARPSAQEMRTRFRLMATVHHPDSGFGSHERMSQLNSAMEYLKDYRD